MDTHSLSRKHLTLAIASLAFSIALALALVGPASAIADETATQGEQNSTQATQQEQTDEEKAPDGTAASDKTDDEAPQQAPEQSPEQDSVTPPVVSATSHVQDIGWMNSEASDDVTLIGTTGKAKRVEAFTIAVTDGPAGAVEYRVHVQNIGWMDWVSEGGSAGTTGKSLAIEAVQMRLTGELGATYNIWYRAHVQNIGWMGWTCGENCVGTSGRSLRLEALEIKLLAKDDSSQSIEQNAFSAPVFTGNAHVQDRGWNNVSADGAAMFGSTGSGLRLEAFNISLGDGVPSAGSILYKAHVQNIGWTNWASNGATAGTTGSGLRIEAVQLKLEGELASTHAIWYRMHVANVGWLGWTSDEALSGTEGSGVRAEALEIQLRAKDSKLESSTPAYLNASMLSASISTLSLGNVDWQAVGLGEASGTSGHGAPMIGLQAGLKQENSSFSGALNYSAHLSNVGWTPAASEGATAGDLNPDHRFEAVSFWLSGDAGIYFDVYYHVLVSGSGWIGWTANGGHAGSTGLGRNIEALEVRVVVKGGEAPGNTASSFSDENGFLAPHPAYVREMLSYAQGFSSATENLILVDTNECNIAIFRGSQGNWSVDTYDRCVCGAWSSPTITGTYTTKYHQSSLADWPNAQYCTNIWGGYFFHSILNSTDELGQHLSHGCIRLDWPLAQYVQTLPLGTTVHLY